MADVPPPLLAETPKAVVFVVMALTMLVAKAIGLRSVEPDQY